MGTFLGKLTNFDVAWTLPPKRRIATVRATVFLIDAMLRVGEHAGFRVAEGVPVSATLVGVTHDPLSNDVILFFEDDSFAEVEPGAVPPMIDIVVSTQCGENSSH